MTNQELLNKVVLAMRAQGVPSVEYNGRCKYRKEGGLKCAIGHIIPDHLYDEEFENMPINTNKTDASANRLIAVVNAILDGADFGLAVALQSCHDEHTSKDCIFSLDSISSLTPWIDLFEKSARAVAARWSLIYPE